MYVLNYGDGYSKVYSKDGIGDFAEYHKLDKNTRLTVYRTKYENDIVEVYDYLGEDTYPEISTFYNKGYLAMPYDHEGAKSYSKFYTAPIYLEPTKEDLEYYKKSLKERVYNGSEYFAFISNLNDEVQRLYIINDSKFALEGHKSEVHIRYSNGGDRELDSDHNEFDVVTRISYIDENGMEYIVRSKIDQTKEERKGKIIFNDDGTFTEILEKSKNDIDVIYNGEVLDLGKVGAISLNDTVYVPIKSLSRNLGFGMDWDMYTKTAIIKIGTDEIRIDDYGNAEINGEQFVTDKPAVNLYNSIYVPIEIIYEGFKTKINWDKENQKVIIE